MGQTVSRVGAQTVDNQLLKPKVVKCLEKRRLKRYILQGKLAPCYEGLAEEESNDLQSEECPICFLNFPALNQAECCSKRICTECFLQVSGRTCLVSDVVCPFCKAHNFAVKFCGPRSKEEQLQEWEEHQKAVAAEISASQSREQPLFSEEEINAVRRSQRSSGGSNSNVVHSRQRSRNPSNNNSSNNINSSTDALILNHSESETQSTQNNNDNLGGLDARPHPLWTQSDAGMLDMSNNMQRVHLGNLIGNDIVQSPPGVLELCRDLGMSLEEINEMLLEHAIASSVLQLTENPGENRQETGSQQQTDSSEQGVLQEVLQAEEEEGEGEDDRNVQEASPSINCWDNEVSVSLHLSQKLDNKGIQTDQQGESSLQQQGQEDKIQILNQLQKQQQPSSSSSVVVSPVVDPYPDLSTAQLPVVNPELSRFTGTLDNSTDNQQNNSCSLQQSEQAPNLNQSDFSMTDQHQDLDSNQIQIQFQSSETQQDDQIACQQCTSQTLMQQQQQNSNYLQEDSNQTENLLELQDESDFIEVGQLGDASNPPEAIIVDLPDESSVLGLLLINDKIVAEIVSVDEEEATNLCPSISFVRDERDQAVKVVIARGDESVREQIQSGDSAVQRATLSSDNYLERLRRLDDEFKSKLEQMDRVVQRNFN